jgi:hypothetical protein
MQNGQDEEGYEGFLMKDIVKAARSIEKNKCDHCKKLSANLHCNQKSCRRFYHTNCALKVNCNFEFEGSFPVYCPHHHQVQFKEEKPLESECGICFDKLNKKNSILIPCCKNSWFHRKCLQKYALTSGYYHFKCPLCADRSKCIEQLPKLGMYFKFNNIFSSIIKFNYF